MVDGESSNSTVRLHSWDGFSLLGADEPGKMGEEMQAFRKMAEEGS